MKIIAAVLAFVFAGSYMSCIVQEAVDDYSKSMAADIKKVEETSVTSEVVTTALETTVTDVPEVTTFIETTTVPVVTTTVPETTTVIETTTEEITTESETEITTTTIATTTSAPVTTAAAVYDYNSPVPKSKNAENKSYFDSCVFVGDSHMNGLGGYEIVDPKSVFAENGLSILRINDKINISDIQAKAPENIYIMMGTNGVMWLDNDEMIDAYEDFVKSLEEAVPLANIYIVSIPPVTAEREKRADVKSGLYLNSDIDSYNDKLLDMAAKNKWYYLDVNSSLKNEDGFLGESTDGVHMARKLYDVFTDYILSHVIE